MLTEVPVRARRAALTDARAMLFDLSRPERRVSPNVGHGQLLKGQPFPLVARQHSKLGDEMGAVLQCDLLRDVAAHSAARGSNSELAQLDL